MLWRVIIVAGYTAMFLVWFAAARQGSRDARYGAPWVLAISGTWVAFYLALLFGVEPLNRWLVGLARSGHGWVITSGIVVGLVLWRREIAHETERRRLQTEVDALRNELTNP